MNEVKEQVTRGAVGFDSSRKERVVVEHVFNDGAFDCVERG